MPSRPTNDTIRPSATRGGARATARTAGTRTGAPKKPGAPRKRRMSKKKRAMYRRRRLVALLVVLAVLAVAVFCGYSLYRGVAGMGDWLGADARMAVSRSAVPRPAVRSKVQDCTADDISMTLAPASQTVALGGSLEFTATVTYTGHDPEGCYVNGADDGRVLVIKSGTETVWRSDSCEDRYRPLLMMEGVTDEQELTWNTNRSGDGCVADDQLPKVDRGTYVAQLVLADDPKVTSEPVTITVA